MALRSRFQGAIVGALVGDCLGAYWERASWRGAHPIDDVKTKIEEQIRHASSKKAPVITYTDDTALTFAMAESLLACRGQDDEHMAKRYAQIIGQPSCLRLTQEYFNDYRRGYGPGVGEVFYKLKNSGFEDLYRPAKEQFRGQGSFGNGGAMRISPVSLFGFHDDKALVEVCTRSTRLTHCHPCGVNGALIQAMAVKLALQAKGDCNPQQFLGTLLKFIQPFEDDGDGAMDASPLIESELPIEASKVKVHLKMGQPTYASRLRQMHALLTQQPRPSAHEVQALLGHGVVAVQAVPCAVYAFLHCSGESFQELIPYAISLGGDADTIASMAGALGGAYWGLEGIPPEWVQRCEESERAKELGGKLYNLTMETEEESQ